MRALLLAAALATATAAHAAEPASAKPATGPSHAWELDAFVGYGQLAFPWPDTTVMTWWNGGPAFAVSIAYRGPHFTHPFLDISYVPIFASGRSVYMPYTNGTEFASNSSKAIGFIVGPGWDVDWLRLRVGIGVYDVLVTSTVTVTGGATTTNSTSALSLGFLASASALVWRPEPFAVGVEARLVALQSPLYGVYQTVWEVGLTGRWDFARHD